MKLGRRRRPSLAPRPPLRRTDGRRGRVAKPRWGKVGRRGYGRSGGEEAAQSVNVVELQTEAAAVDSASLGVVRCPAFGKLAADRGQIDRRRRRVFRLRSLLMCSRFGSRLHLHPAPRRGVTVASIPIPRLAPRTLRRNPDR